MPRPARPWFRFYSEALSNAKVFALGTAQPTLFFQWVMLLNLANISNKRGFLPADISDIAFALRESPQKTAEILSELQRMEFIDLRGQRLYMHNWHKWNPDSDANLTKARGKRNERTPKERAKNGERTGIERLERDREKDEERDIDGEEIARAPVPSHPFSLAYVKNWQETHAGNRPSSISHGQIVALEKEHGSDRCFQAAAERGWDKPAPYYREWLLDPSNTKEARNGRSKALVGASRGGARSVLSNDDLDDLERYKRGEVN
jgi:uncharacterized protein YqcC (DUF446 family)